MTQFILLFSLLSKTVFSTGLQHYLSEEQTRKDETDFAEFFKKGHKSLLQLMQRDPELCFNRLFFCEFFFGELTEEEKNKMKSLAEYSPFLTFTEIINKTIFELTNGKTTNIYHYNYLYTNIRNLIFDERFLEFNTVFISMREHHEKKKEELRVFQESSAPGYAKNTRFFQKRREYYTMNELIKISDKNGIDFQMLKIFFRHSYVKFRPTLFLNIGYKLLYQTRVNECLAICDSEKKQLKRFFAVRFNHSSDFEGKKINVEDVKKALVGAANQYLKNR